MTFKNIISQFNVPAQCRRYGLPLWQCPHFLFLIMGLAIIVSTLITYILGTRYIESPEIVALIVLLLTAVLLIVAFTIVRSFERLAEANRMKSEFINIVSHQLRSPLSNLGWVIDLLMSSKLRKNEERQAEYFLILKENTARMKEMVSDLLTVSRIETATLALKKQEFILEELIEKIILEFSPLAKASNVEIEFQKKTKLEKIFSDPYQIKQVIENLLDNAIRYIKEKGRVVVELKKKDKGFYCEIKDNGIGIPQEDQKYIFQKFFRAKNATSQQTHGFGLGLYIVKSIIEKLGGKIGFFSQEGKGSTFWFTLPC